MSFSKYAIAGALGLASLLAGAAGVAAPKKEKLDPAAVKEAEQIYTSVCATCHGATGMGDGPTGKVITPKPANFQDKAFQKSRTDEQLSKVILQGGMSVGKSPLMPGQPQLKDKPEVLKAVIAKVRGFEKKK
jgi:hypothetical protein